MINTGFIEQYLSGATGGILLRLRYNPGTQAIENWTDEQSVVHPALEITNTTGRPTKIVFKNSAGATLADVNVTSAGFSRNAAQLAALGVTTRSDVGDVSMSFA